MFGAIRLALSLAVALDHTAGTRLATYAVPMFFVISGYLMTAVMHGSYGYGPRGVGRFFLNRGLRLMPPYWAATALSLLAARLFWPGHDPASGADWLRLGTLVTLDGAEPWVVNAPVWSLPVEEFFYAAMAVGASRTLRSTLLWLAVSVALRAIWWRDADFDERYHAAWFASLWFSFGALAWYARGRLSPRWGLVVIGGVVAARVLPGVVTGRGFDMVALYNAPAVVAMSCWAAAVSALGPVRAPRWDRALGDLSYPVYLFHWPVAILLGARPVNPSAGSAALGAATAAVTLALAVAVDRGLSRPVERLRDRFRRPGPERAARPARLVAT